MGKKESKKEEVKVYSSIDKKIQKLQALIIKLQQEK
tara:strand:- start:502 stop:609 length:108 start_codon:yes stop_codon:yes gene_type:complete